MNALLTLVRVQSTKFVTQDTRALNAEHCLHVLFKFGIG